MNILNAKYKTQPMKWDSITFPLLQGTPINADGEISNDEDAIGMVTETFTARPLLPALSIVIAGDIEEKEIVYELSDAAVAAMSGIRIYNADGSREGSGGGATLYRHKVVLQGTSDNPEEDDWNLNFTLIIISSDETEIDSMESIEEAVESAGIVLANGHYHYDFNADDYAINIYNFGNGLGWTYYHFETGEFYSVDGGSLSNILELVQTISDTVTEV